MSLSEANESDRLIKWPTGERDEPNCKQVSVSGNKFAQWDITALMVVIMSFTNNVFELSEDLNKLKQTYYNLLLHNLYYYTSYYDLSKCVSNFSFPFFV